MPRTGRFSFGKASGCSMRAAIRLFILFMFLSNPALAGPSLLTPASGACIVGQELPSFAIPDHTGMLVSSRNLLSTGRPLLIGLWAPWCKPCIRSMDAIHEWGLSRQAAGLDCINVLFISVGKEQAKADSIVEAKAWSFTTAHDRYQLIANRLGFNNKLPYSILADSNGRVRKIFLSEGDDWIQLIEESLELPLY